MVHHHQDLVPADPVPAALAVVLLDDLAAVEAARRPVVLLHAAPHEEQLARLRMVLLEEPVAGEQLV